MSMAISIYPADFLVVNCSNDNWSSATSVHHEQLSLRPQRQLSMVDRSRRYTNLLDTQCRAMTNDIYRPRLINNINFILIISGLYRSMRLARGSILV